LRVQGLKIAMPGRMFELQRRVFYRTPVPARFEIEVHVRRDGQDGANGASSCAGRLTDISAGGLSIELPADQAPDWPSDTPTQCSLVCTSPELRIDAPTQFRHREQAGAGNVRLGLKFAGLEATPEGRAALQGILDLTTDLQAGA
jgi:c-di-GMP-binding flagellar brake protein YcgR